MSDSDSAEENVIRYGTPLDPYEEDEVPAKKRFQQQQEYAVDEHGRRRFHGAFTGGFSAGYGNTVGTPDGWAPASFKSSRSEKAQVSNQRPEDFMDEEDRSEYGIAPRQIQTKSEFSGHKRQRQQQFHDGPIPGEPVLQQLVRPVHETAAVRMLKAMGWREGQGAGERLPGEEKRRAREQHRVYGCYVPPEMRDKNPAPDDEDSSGSEVDYETLFAPDDYEPYVLNRKNDRFGLGYSGLSRHSVLGNLVGEYGSEAGASRSHLVMKEKNKKVSIRGQAFGVGAFEADDEDIYATEDMSHYDFSLGAPAENQKPKKMDKVSNVLVGFVKAGRPLPAVPSYPPPALPRDYAPAAAGSRRSRFEPTDQKPRDQGLGRHELTAEARGALLGEAPIPKASAEPMAVEEDQKERAAGGVVPEEATVPKELDFIPIKDSGKDPPRVFRPFASDRKKQARYEMYLRGGETPRDGAADRLSEWERSREEMEFEQAAKLYRPLSGIMEERFTHASQPDEALNPLCAVAKSVNEHGLATAEQVEAAKIGAFGAITRREGPWRPEALVCKRFNVPEPGTTRAEPQKEDKPKVSYSIFSYLESSVHDKESFTREQSKFSGSKSLSVDAKTTAKSKPTSDEKKIEDKKEATPITAPITTGFNKRMTVAELFLKESERDLKNKEQGADVTETIQKFDKMDLYKSIFLSDSENEEETANEATTERKNAGDFVDRPKNVERNTSPPRGIFANIDFDELNSWKQNTGDRGTDAPTVGSGDKEVTPPRNANGGGQDNTQPSDGDTTKEANDQPDVYGPKIPENLKKRLEAPAPAADNFKPMYRSKDERDLTVTIESSSDSESWVEAKMPKAKNKKDKKKKSKKHKSKHKKSKHKKKDR
ncbi:unnamed protein product, partial [Iphiclides podalirius]